MTDLPPSFPATEPRARRRWLLAVVIALAVILAAAGAWYLWGASSSKTPTGAQGGEKGKFGKGGKGGRFGGGAGGPQPVAATPATVGDIHVVQTSIGTVTALRVATVRPRVDGLLQSVEFTEGEQISAGTVLAHIDPATFRVALEQAEGQLARDAAQLNNARLDLERYRTLLQQDSIASQQVDQQGSLVRQLEGTVKFDQAQVDNAKLQLSYTSITAPIGGRLGLRLVDPGNMVRASDTNGIAVITQVDPITVVFTIPQDVLPKVLANLRGNKKMDVEAWDREQKAMLARGFLITTDNQIDVGTGTVKLKAQFTNVKGALFPNQFVNVRMVVDTLHDVVVVPTAAVQRNAQGANVVYVVQNDTVNVRPIAAGPIEGTNTAVEKGLQPGELVITDGVDRIREGSKVEIATPGAGAREGPGGGPAEAETGKGASREDWKKKLEAMTPEQREQFKKRREERAKGGQ